MNRLGYHRLDDWWTLSNREREVLRLAADGLTAWETGRVLFISEATVKNHRENVQRRFKARNMCHAVAIGYERGVLQAREAEAA